MIMRCSWEGGVWHGNDNYWAGDKSDVSLLTHANREMGEYVDAAGQVVVVYSGDLWSLLVKNHASPKVRRPLSCSVVH